jgi:hypothetical protein
LVRCSVFLPDVLSGKNKYVRDQENTSRKNIPTVK